jgi:hypothetical protein
VRRDLPPQVGLDVLGAQHDRHAAAGHAIDVRKRMQLLHVDDVDGVTQAAPHLAGQGRLPVALDGGRTRREASPDEALDPAALANRHEAALQAPESVGRLRS